MFTSDYVLNGVGHGAVGQRLQQFNFDPGMARPFFDSRGRRCVTINTGRGRYDDLGRWVPERKTVEIRHLMNRGIFHPLWNATSLRKGDWIHLDQVVVRAARKRLKAWEMLAAKSSVGGFDAMSKTTYEYESMNDVGEAIVDMDGIAEGRHDSPLFKLNSLPLPITHSNFHYSQRRLAASGNSNTPLDVTSAEMAGRRVAEMIEKTVIGIETGLNFGTQAAGNYAATGTSQVYGFRNFPYRLTKTDLSTPTGSNPEAVMTDALEMVETMETNGFYGPYVLFHSTAYTRYLNDDYFRTGSTNPRTTLRDRILEIGGIESINRLDFLDSTYGYEMILVQMDSDTAQAINGMDITTLMWESQGGMKINWKVMCIQVPMLKRRYNDTCAILHATTS